MALDKCPGSTAGRAGLGPWAPAQRGQPGPRGHSHALSPSLRAPCHAQAGWELAQSTANPQTLGMQKSGFPAT